MGLVGVVVGLGLKDDVQADVEVAIVNSSAQVLVQVADSEKNYSRMLRQIFLASRDQFFLGGRGVIAQCEVDVVCQKRFGHRVSPNAIWVPNYSPASLFSLLSPVRHKHHPRS